jgi:hypothetical protein
MKRFTLPQSCECGAQGSITFEPAPKPALAVADPHPKIVAADGAFRLDGEGIVSCRNCGARLGAGDF